MENVDFETETKRLELKEAKQAAKLRSSFTCFDVNQSGTLTAEEFLALLTYSSSGAGAKGLTIEDAQALVTEFDTNGDGVLDIDELCKAWNAIRSNAELESAKKKRKADAVLFDEIMALQSEYLEKHLKMLTDLAAKVRSDDAIEPELALMDKIGNALSHIQEQGTENEEFKAMATELAAIETNNEAALGELFSEMGRANAYKKKSKELIEQMLSELGRTDNWYMTPPIVCKRKALHRFSLRHVGGDADEHVEQQKRWELMVLNEARQKASMFEELYDSKFDGQLPSEAETDALGDEFNASFAYDEDKWYADQEEAYFLMGISVPDFLKRENKPSPEQLIQMGKESRFGR